MVVKTVLTITEKKWTQQVLFICRELNSIPSHSVIGMLAYFSLASTEVAIQVLWSELFGGEPQPIKWKVACLKLLQYHTLQDLPTNKDYTIH
jgi:hypothetical protein